VVNACTKKVMEFDFHYNKDFIGLFAPKGSGKTYLIKNILKHIPEVVILDTNYEYSEFESKNIKIVKPTDLSTKYLDKFLSELNIRNVCVVIDDIDAYIPKNSKELTKLLAISRHKGMGLIFVSRRPKNLNNVMVLSLDYLFLGYPILPQDKIYIESIANIQIDNELFTSLKQYQFLAINIKTREMGIVYV